MHITFLSYGGGVESVAMLVLIKRGILPKPDLIMMADTHREASTTWQYLEEHARPIMAELDIPFAIPSKEHTRIDLYANNGDLLLPMFTKTGKLPTFCSHHWKRFPIMRALRELRAKTATCWLGISLGESHRASRLVKSNKLKWYSYKFPLLEKHLTRGDCESLLKDEGLPVPAKSACWMCPNMNPAEWQALKTNAPQDFENAVQLEQEIQLFDPDLRLTRYGKNLDEVDFTEHIDPDPEPSQCGFGYCMI